MVPECAPSWHMYHRPMTWPTNMVLQCATNKSRMRVHDMEPRKLQNPVQYILAYISALHCIIGKESVGYAGTTINI